MSGTPQPVRYWRRRRRRTAPPLAPALHFHAGDALVHAGKFAEANAQFDLVLERWPDGEYSDDSKLGKLHAALAADDHAAVDHIAEEFAKQFSDSPLTPAVERTLAKSLLARKEPDRAVGILEQLVTHELAAPKEPSGGCAPNPAHDALTHRYLLALAYEGVNRHEDALKTLEPVLALPGGELKIDAQRAQATALVALQKFAEAIAPLEAYLAANSKGEAAAWGRPN